MERIRMEERPGWKRQAEELGFIFHTMYGETYWDETAAYRFSLKQIENHIEDPTAELHQMCLAVVARAVDDDEIMRRLAIPEAHWDFVRNSWRRQDPSLYGRFDLVYDGTGPAKMLEYNADTPTSLYESAFYQWVWLDNNIQMNRLPSWADQYNSLQDKLIGRLSAIFEAGDHLHFASCTGSDEDRATVKYLEDCAHQAGLVPHYVEVEQIGTDAAGRYADADSHVIDAIFKLYPWEQMLRDEYARHLASSTTKFVEPAWKAVLSNKAVLPLLWQMFPNHPNLLPAYFADDPGASNIGDTFVKKPLFSREGANIEIVRGNSPLMKTDGEYGAEGHIVQAFSPLPQFDGNYTVIGSWIIGDEPAGMGIREDSSLITRDLSRFLPHMIL